MKNRFIQDNASADEFAQRNASDEHEALTQTMASERITCEKDVEKTALPTKLSEELQTLLEDSNFEPLCKALREENIVTIQQLSEIQLWTFLNRHNLYPIAERISIFDYLKDRISPDSSFDSKLSIVEETMEDTDSKRKTVKESEVECISVDTQNSVEIFGSDKTLGSGDHAHAIGELGSEQTLNSVERRNTTGTCESQKSIDVYVENEDTSRETQKEENYNSLQETMFAQGQKIDKDTEENTDQISPLDVSINNPSSTPYYKVFALPPDEFRSIMATECGFSTRTYNCLRRNKIISVGDLLEQSDAGVLSIKGFGANSLKELRDYFNRLERNCFATPAQRTIRKKLTDELALYTRYICNGDFSFVADRKFSQKSQTILAKYIRAYEYIDRELIDSIVEREPGALAVVDMISKFVTENEKARRCRSALQSIPVDRKQIQAHNVICSYTSDDEKRLFLISRDDCGETLEQFVYKNAILFVENDAQMIDFVRWCSYNIVDEINEFFDRRLQNDRVRRIFCGRAHGKTLTQLGDEFGITRERVRQIEAKVFRRSRVWFGENRVIYKLFLDLGAQNSLYTFQIIDYLGQYGEETASILKRLSGTDYFYNERFDLFTLDNPIDCEAMQEFVDSMPNVIAAEKLDDIISDGAHQLGFSEDLIQIVFDDNYRRTGNLYHRSRLSLANIYCEIIRRFYPKGIHLDDEEMICFREHVQKVFGIDISDKNTNSISSIINRTCILCGRGRYRLKAEGSYISDHLTKQIRDYVENSATATMLISSIFAEFEEELRAEGVNNRYYLQGILKELFGDNWFFKRDYVITDSNVTSFYDAVVDYISKGNSPVSKEAIMREFPGISDFIINYVVSGSEIINLFGSYIHASQLRISETDIRYLRNKLEESLSEEDVCYSRDLFSLIKVEKPWLLSNNYITAGFGLYSLLEYLFFDDYNFSRPFIAKEGSKIKSIYSVMREMVAESELIELSEITTFASEHNYKIPRVLDFINSCNESHLMINAHELATFDYIGVNEDIAKQISQCIFDEVREAIPISHLKCIHLLPKINVEWNAWLIYSILNKWSKDLVVGTSKAPFRLSYPVVALSGSNLEVEFDETISHDGEVFCADNLDNIEDLIADYVFKELENLDEL